MSYTSQSRLSKTSRLAKVLELITLLDYRRVDDGLRIPGREGAFFWWDSIDYRSWTGVELNVHRTSKGTITVTTRSRISRSYWDLVHQNKTIKLLRDFFGGHFTTDEGRGRYLRPPGKPPSPVSSGCFLARWRFHNAFSKVMMYRAFREFSGTSARKEPTGLSFMDEFNPRLFSNNLVLPYAVAIWEEYFKSTFVVLLKHSRNREGALKKARLSHGQLEALATGDQSVEDAVGASISFQRPSAISQHFAILDPKLNLAAVLKRPYRRRRVSLYSSIEALVEQRHSFVHTGAMDTRLTDKRAETALKDLEVAVDRTYVLFGQHFGFPLIRDY